MTNVLRDVIALQLRVEQQKTTAVPSMAHVPSMASKRVIDF